MKSISIQLNEQTFDETEKIINKKKVDRNRYINEAIVYYNQFQQKKISGRQLETESKLVQQESMRVLSEFEKLNDDATTI